MSDKKKYVIVTSHCTKDGIESYGDILSLEANVNIYLNQGWELAGGAFYAPTSVDTGYFAQAITGHGVDF